MPNLDVFRALVRSEGARLYRDLPWRRTRDAYGIWISEVMLQQTQVPRVLDRWGRWLERFPSVEVLAEAAVSEVLSEWQGMGYNRRALALKSAAEHIVSSFDGEFPHDAKALCSLPGIGPATAQGIRAFAFDEPGVYLETNVRAVMLHHFFPEMPGVPDRELIPLVEASCPVGVKDMGRPGACRDGARGAYALPLDEDDTPRSWYYAMLDYGAYLKKTLPNPSRRSSGYVKQSRFEGSRRQKRAHIVRILLADGEASSAGMDAAQIGERLNEVERAAGRGAVEPQLVASILSDLSAEGFCVERDGCFFVAP